MERGEEKEEFDQSFIRDIKKPLAFDPTSLISFIFPHQRGDILRPSELSYFLSLKGFILYGKMTHSKPESVVHSAAPLRSYVNDAGFAEKSQSES